MVTLAGSYYGNYKKFKTIIEAAYQFGKYIEVRDISSYLISAAVKYNLGILDLGAGADILSGTDPNSTDTKNSFETTFGANHKFYGYMDYFINIPGNTYNFGLNDFYVSTNIIPKGSKFKFDAVLHLFMSNQSTTITTTENPEGGDENMFGQELDLTIKYEFTENTSLVWGGSLFFPGELFKTVYSPREDTGYWTYLMITAAL